jgi:inner membrane protein
MSGDTHAVVGALTATLVMHPNNLQEFAVSAGIGALGGLLVDIDLKQSTGSKIMKKLVTMMLGVSLVVLVGVLKGGVSAPKFNLANCSQMLIGALMFIGLVIIGSKSSHRMVTHSIEFALLFFISILLIQPQFAVPMLCGYVSHIILDLFNKKNVRVSMIFNFKCCLDLVPANGKANSIVMWASMFGLSMCALSVL